MNKKGQIRIILFTLIIFILFSFLILIFQNVSYQHGTSRDIVQGYDEGIIWYHAYLKNDHNTAYCFDDERFIQLLEKSQKEQIEVLITYEKYIGRGTFCSTAENYETVVIKNIEMVE